MDKSLRLLKIINVWTIFSPYKHCTNSHILQFDADTIQYNYFDLSWRQVRLAKHVGVFILASCFQDLQYDLQ